MPPLVVLFDFDGVIADTENIHVAAWERTFGSMGWDVPPEDCARAAEVDDRAFLTGLLAVRGIDGGDVAGWVRRKQETTLALLADAPRIYPGVRELVGHLRGRARLAVVATTWRENIAAVLGPAGLAGAFELVIAKEDVRALKPEPDAYLLALKRLKLPAARAVALEDSATGLTAARAAGLRCVAVGHRRPAGDWAADATFVAGLDDLPQTLAALGLGGGEPSRR